MTQYIHRLLLDTAVSYGRDILEVFCPYGVLSSRFFHLHGRGIVERVSFQIEKPRFLYMAWLLVINKIQTCSFIQILSRRRFYIFSFLCFNVLPTSRIRRCCRSDTPSAAASRAASLRTGRLRRPPRSGGVCAATGARGIGEGVVVFECTDAKWKTAVSLWRFLLPAKCRYVLFLFLAPQTSISSTVYCEHTVFFGAALTPQQHSLVRAAIGSRSIGFGISDGVVVFE